MLGSDERCSRIHISQLRAAKIFIFWVLMFYSDRGFPDTNLGSNAQTQKSFLQKIYGEPSSNIFRFGAFVYHIGDSCSSGQCSNAYPYVSLTFKGVKLSYFKNTFHRDTYGITVERTWLAKNLNKNFDLNVNYALGVLLGGYCIKSLSCEPKSLPVIPVLQVIFGITFKKRVEIDFTWLGAVFTLNVGYRF